MKTLRVVLGIWVVPLIAFSCRGDLGADGEAFVQEWTISAEPRLSMDLPVVGYCGIQQTSDGRLVVCDKEHGVLRVYDGGGQQLGSWGGPGDGLGGFRRLLLLGPWQGDSLVALDRFRLAGTVLDENGNAARRFEYAVPENRKSTLEVHGFFPDGAILTTSSLLPSTVGERLEWSLTEGAIVDSTEYGVADEQRYEVLGRDRPGGEYRVAVGNSTYILVPPLANRRLVAVGTSAWATAWTHYLEITVRMRPGHDTRNIVVSSQRVSSPTGQDEAIKSSWVNEGPAESRAHRQRLLDLTEGTGQPPELAGRLLGPGDEVWVAELGTSTIAQRWSIYSSDGLKIGRLTIPQGHRLLQVLEGCVLLASNDGSTVLLHGLRRGV
ncbi:MAG: hypothetical protein MUO50_10825 [Longimicrobiales bacterium]|nr:hypothetical protein [Longimicrobiales bacterium]